MNSMVCLYGVISLAVLIILICNSPHSRLFLVYFVFLDSFDTYFKIDIVETDLSI